MRSSTPPAAGIAPDVRDTALPARGKVDGVAVTRPARLVLVARTLGQPTRRAPLDVDRPDVPVPVFALRVESDVPAVRRPARRALAEPRPVGELGRVGAVGVGEPDLVRVARAFGLERDAPSVRRKVRAVVHERGGEHWLGADAPSRTGRCPCPPAPARTPAGPESRRPMASPPSGRRARSVSEGPSPRARRARAYGP